MIDKAYESYKLYKKVGQIKESKDIKKKIVEMQYAKEHLLMVMNFDFDRPSARMKEMANKNKINLKDESVIEEFKLIQKQNLEDIRRLRKGLPPLTEEE
eukprot:CAMPEP_0176404430 /NCGR_PEP_ID=MMETSP0126-20121128/50861_1 /TAXON_ID=141414 ORGANISM="Strombidinopsis acuminatum, Strain SPMC142" /NCGR_SAMPLE_ID=MMETSP0126 /ASSEMBLY_ACC=CAM_ASM_000229 /LENGTH=98 /DNA_ID=CAMNT_0017783221 /DNA_START=1055 /DNA_END=1351 /DNA_ORIENTATION=+